MKLQDVTRLYNFTGKTVVVTGGSGVLGREMARALVGCNANVAILVATERAANRRCNISQATRVHRGEQSSSPLMCSTNRR